ncbi:diguanylate cyclase domain-containing protein [Solibacillus cecembensis]|uniref:diguanylate cyclase domain-containing protein n=1 Tax=Solibacillus cecembensis TaxID=459347 RepID=UPI003D064CC2
MKVMINLDKREFIMLLNILYIFCILTTFSILIYWPLLYYKENPIIYRFYPYMIGLNFGIAGIFLTAFSAEFAFGIMVNSRIIPLLFSGLLGGPIALLISGFIMGISRFIQSGFTTDTLIINFNFIVLVIVLFFAGRKYHYNYQNIYTYFWFSSIEMAFVILAIVFYRGGGFLLVLLYTIFTIISFYSIYFIVNQIKNTNQKINETKYLSKIDYLTQLPNNATIEKYVLDALAKEKCFTLMLLHINDFKSILSTHGYQFGDVVIKQLAQFLQEYANKNGAFVGKLNGEEFIIVLKDVAPAIAVTEAHTINKEIARHHVKVQITTSIGLASFPDNGNNYQSLIKSLISTQQHAKNNLPVAYFHANNLKKK